MAKLMLLLFRIFSQESEHKGLFGSLLYTAIAQKLHWMLDQACLSYLA